VQPLYYPIAVEPASEEGTAFGVVVPDLPGCFSAGDTLDEAFLNAVQAAAAWIDAASDDNRTIPAPSSLAHVRARPEFDGWIFGIIPIDPT
jgi:predicted RNase H-like HicB family nuclease